MPPTPFRWSQAGERPQRTGALTYGAQPPDLWYLPALTDCAAKVLTRTSAADLCFVGRSLDSMYDLLTGAFDGTSRKADNRHGGLRRLPVSCSGLGPDDAVPAHVRRRLREHLAAVGLSPAALARRERPVALVDVVHSGGTFDILHGELARWIAETREPWNVIRRKLRYAGVTERGRTSPHHWRWQQSQASRPWVRTLPSGHVVNVSVDRYVWNWLGVGQPKVARSFPPARWFDADADAPPRHAGLPDALTESAALVAAGRGRAVRAALVRAMAEEPGFAVREVRALALELRRGRRRA
ncbi:hypothetical protein ACWGJ2_18170 [Streptomyces sp. NPDC054796]